MPGSIRSTPSRAQRATASSDRVYSLLHADPTVIESTDAIDLAEIAGQIEQLARHDDYFVERDLYANVDYYSAVVLYMIDLPIDQFTCAFAMSRIAGWTAHVLEQLADNRLIRPKARYVGSEPRSFSSLKER